MIANAVWNYVMYIRQEEPPEEEKEVEEWHQYKFADQWSRNNSVE